MTGGDLPTGLIDEPPPSGGPSPTGGDEKSCDISLEGLPRSNCRRSSRKVPGL